MKHKTSLIKIKQFFIRNTRLFFYYLFNLSKKAKKNFKKFSFRKTVKFVIKLPSLVKRFFSPRKVKRFFRNYFTLEKIVNSIRKLFAIRKFRRSFAAFVFAMLVFQYFFPIIPFLPTIPFSPNEKRTVNADINEAEANDNAMFVNVNPEFKVEFGDRNDETLHRVRFEADPSVENPFASKTSDKIKENILEKVKNKLFPTEKGIEFSLVSAQLEGDIVMDQEASNVVQNNDTPLVDNESGTEEELSDNSTNEDVSSQKSAEELALENMKRELSESAEKLKSQMSDDEIDKKSQELTKLITEAREVYAKTELSEDDGTNVVTNPEVIPGVDVKYKILEGLGVKEDIVINRLDSYDADCIQKAIEEGKTDPENFNCQMPKNSYTFNLKLDPGVEVHQAIGSLGGLPNGTYYFTDSNGKYLFHFLTPYAVDARDRKTNDVKIEVSKVEQNQNSLISKIVNPEENLQNSGYAIESISSLGEKVKNVFGNIAKADDEDQNNLENAGSSSQIDQEEASSNQIEPETQAASENEGEERAPMTEFKKLVGQNQTEYQVKITVDPTWLLDSTRAYPITIDPSIVHDTEAEFDTGDSLNRVESIAGPKVQIQNPNGGNDQYTKLLLHSDGTNGSTIFPDSSYVMSQRKTITANGGTQIATAQSKFGGSSAYFDGSGDYLTVPDSNDFEMNYDLTIDTWVYPTSLPVGGRIVFAKGDSSQFGPYLIQLQSDDGVTGYWYFYSSSNGSSWDVASNVLIGTATVNTWQHLAMVRTGNTIKLFLNGVKASSDVTISSQPIDNSSSFVIGRIAESAASQEFVGYVDELRVSKGIARWTNDFTSPERAYDYQKNYGVYTSSAMQLGAAATSIDSLQWTENGVQTGNGETPYSSTSLVGSWNFNETSGTSAADSSGNGHTGTLTNFSSTGSQDAAANSGWTSNNRKWGAGALTFDGSNDYVSVSPTGFDFATGTIEFWMKSNEDGWGDAIGFDSSGYPNQLFIGTKEAGKAAFLCNIGNNYNAYVDVPNGDWHHWALVVNDSGNKIYRDGIQVTPTYDTGDASKNCFLDDISPTSFNFGIRGTDSAHPFKGSLDAVRIYSRALSAEEILSDYQVGNIEFQTRTGNTSTPNDGTWEDWKPAEGTTETQFKSEDNAYLYDNQDSNLTSYWPMDETADNSCSGATNDVCDKKGTSDGAATGTRITDGKFGKGRYFNGSTDWIKVNSMASNPFDSSHTVSGWIKLDQVGITNRFNFIAGSGWGNGRYLSVYQDKIFYSVPGVAGYSSTRTITDTNWHYVTATYDASNLNLKLYLDGILDTNTTITDNTDAGSTCIFIGSLTQDCSSVYAAEEPTTYYKAMGSLDEVSIYNGVQSAQQVYLDYQKGIESGRIGNSIQETAEKDNWTKLLLHADGANASTTFADSSLSKNPVTVNGDAQISTAQSKFGGSSVYFDGNGDYLSISNSSDWNFGSENFTIDFWVYATDTNTAGVIIDKSYWTSGQSGAYRISLDTSSSNSGINFVTSDGTGNDEQINSGNYLNLGEWNHVTIVREGTSSNQSKIYINGTMRGQSTISKSLGQNSAELRIGYFQGYSSGYTYFNGYIDDFRISKGIARWTDDFTPPTSEHTLKSQISAEGTGSKKIQTGASQVSGNTVALWHMEETGGSSAYIKDSAGSNNGTPTGTTSVDGISGKGRSFNGSSDYIAFSDSDDWTWPGDFSVDFWIKFNNVGTNQVIINHANDGAFFRLMWQSSSEWNIYIANSVSDYGYQSFSDSLSTNVWYHVAVTRTSGTVKLFRDGMQKGSDWTNSRTPNPDSGGVKIGISYSGAGSNLNGYLDEFRVAKGSALSANDISNIYRTGRDVRIGQTVGDEYTKLLLHSNGTNTSTTFTDSSLSKNSITVNGNTQISTAQSKFGGSSAYFDGSGDYLDISASDDWKMVSESSNFAVDFWIKSSSGAETYIAGNDDQYSGSRNGVWSIFRASTSGIFYFWVRNDSGSTANASLTSSDANTYIFDNNWHHVACVKNGSTLSIYADGVLRGTTGTAPSGNYTGNYNLRLGMNPATVFAPFTGYIDEFRVSKGIARWASNFTSPSAEYFSGDFSSVSKIPFYIAADRPGTYLEATVGESSFANNEADSNTVGLWHLDEENGSGAYMKDSSGYGNHGTPGGATSIDGIFGKARNFDGSGDYINLGSATSLDFGNNGPFTFSGWVRPTTLVDYAAFVSKDTSGRTSPYTYMTTFMADGRLESYNGSAWADVCPASSVSNGKWQYVTFAYDGTNLSGYVNGNKCGSIAFSYTDNVAHDVTIGSWNSGVTTYDFNGVIDEVCIDKSARSASEIRQAYEIGKRTHKITIDFGASLSSGDLITGQSDTSFTVDATTKGLKYEGEGLYKGDKIIIKENYNGTEYIAQGTVTGITTSTGETTVASWDEGSTFPSSGFTANATVFKWQREYMDLTGTMDDQIDATNRMTLRVTDGIEGRSIWLDDFESVSSYLTDSSATGNVTSTLGNYIQYRAIISSTDSMVTPYISGISTNYSGGPTLDLIMRHGKWFSGGAKQSFWWVN